MSMMTRLRTIPQRLVDLPKRVRFYWKVRNLPDRLYLDNTMLPSISRTMRAIPERQGVSDVNVLLVGTRRYNVKAPRVIGHPQVRVWTIDMDPKAAKWGNGSLHRTGDICDVAELFPGIRFDLVKLNGILGFGIDTPEQIRSLVIAISGSLQPGGFMMLGWDADRTDDPTDNDEIRARFVHQGLGDLPARQSFIGYAGFDHVFDWFQKR